MTCLQQVHQCLLTSRNGPSWPRQTSLRNALLNKCKMLVLAVLISVNPTNRSGDLYDFMLLSISQGTSRATSSGHPAKQQQWPNHAVNDIPRTLAPAGSVVGSSATKLEKK